MGDWTNYDRYAKLRDESGFVDPSFPFITIPEMKTDIIIKYDRRTMRMDTLSYKYYGDPNFGWLIMQANPSLGMWEYLIKDGESLRIPYPLDSALSAYEGAIDEYKSTH